MDAPTITIGKFPVTLVKPKTTAALALCRSEADRATDGHEVARCFGAAAIAICWPADATWLVPTRPLPWRPGVPMAEYGGRVLDDLCEVFHILDLLPRLDGDTFDPGPLQTALDWAVTSRILRAEVEAAQDFSGAPMGA